MFTLYWFIGLTAIAYQGGAVNALDLKMFDDLMQFNQLKYAVITQNLTILRKFIQHRDMQEFVNKYRLKFQPIPMANKTSNFGIGHTFTISRVGIIFPQIEDFSHHWEFFQILKNDKNIFNNTRVWMFHLKQINVDWQFIRNIFEEQNLNIDTDITLAVDHTNGSRLLYDIYKICHNCATEVLIEPKGLWSHPVGLKLEPRFQESFVRRRRNWQNISINVVTTLLEKPENLTNAEYLENFANNKQLDFMQRKTYHLMTNLQNMFNFSFNVKYSDSWVGKSKDKSSVISMLADHEAEFSVCPLRSTTDRLEHISFSPHIHTEPICFILRHPRRSVIRNIFFEPLANQVWWAILFIIIIAILLLVLHMQQEARRQKSSLCRHLERRFDTAILTILESIFMQGPSPDSFKLTSTRTLITVVCTFSLLMMQFYSAFIVGSLLSESPRTITNLDVLYNSSFEIGMEDIPYNYEFLRNSSFSLARDLYFKRIMRNPPKNIVPLTRGVERVGRGGFAFYVSTLRAYRYLKSIMSERVFCELQEIYVDPPFESYVAISKTSSYREHIFQSILLWHMSGIIKYNNKHWDLPDTDCSLTKNKEVEVDLDHFLPAIAFLAAASSLALVVLTFEILYKKFRG